MMFMFSVRRTMKQPLCTHTHTHTHTELSHCIITVCVCRWWCCSVNRSAGGALMMSLCGLLSALSDDDLSAAPFSIENQSHRQIILEELHKLKETSVSLNLWQYKVRKTLFLLISLRNLPRVTLLYLFLFDYEDTFLPFIHTSCPATPDAPTDTPLDWPGWSQWAEFLLMYFLLPYQLLSAFAWHWMSVHYWTAGFIIAHATLLTVYTHTHTIHAPLLFNTSLFVLPWPLMPLFIINTEIYIQLYLNPFLTAVLVKRTLLPASTQHRP
uniref:Uncharacterized protein n=1 Tax=Sinocyclocheilus anshuiensis TaxID=1608454 RepID=A0A671NB54_9TELE